MRPLRPIDNRGIALLMTLAFITLAMSLAVEANRQSRLAIQSTGALQHRLLAGQMAAAGVHAAMAVLIQDRYDSETDHLKEAWADPEQLAEALQAVAFEEGRLEVRITDELARLQINALVDYPQSRQFNSEQQQIMMRLIGALRGEDEAQSDLGAADIVNAIKDWLDQGDDDAITGLNGAESDYYQGLSPPYACRNGPMAHIGELAQVKGISADLFNGGTTAPGLKDCLTVFGASKAAGGEVSFPGRVNLNTVSETVLAAVLPPEYRDFAAAVIQYRDEADPEVLEGQGWYREIPGAAGLELSPEVISLTSDTFRIEAAAESAGIRATVFAVVERLAATDGGGWTCRIRAWETR
jgi:general secretion pathway protein K